jgi:Na+-transporting NADH:ubiquinone oxidoreductase subunit F
MITGLLSLAVTAGIFIFLAILLLIAERYLVNYGSCLVRINEGSVEFEQPGGGTLLSALYEHKVFIPSACGGKGSCGYCKVVVLEGGGPLLPTETPYINRSEAKAGVRLACQVKIKLPMDLRLPEDLLNVREFKARVSLIRELTHDIKEVNFELNEPTEIKQRSGQYIQILAPGPDGPVFRAYSISSPAHENHKVQLVVRLSIRSIRDGRTAPAICFSVAARKAMCFISGGSRSWRRSIRTLKLCTAFLIPWRRMSSGTETPGSSTYPLTSDCWSNRIDRLSSADLHR